MKHLKDKRECFRVDVLDEVISDSKRFIQRKYGLEKTLTEASKEMSEVEANENSECVQQLNAYIVVLPLKIWKFKLDNWQNNYISMKVDHFQQTQRLTQRNSAK